MGGRRAAPSPPHLPLQRGKDRDGVLWLLAGRREGKLVPQSHPAVGGIPFQTLPYSFPSYSFRIPHRIPGFHSPGRSDQKELVGGLAAPSPFIERRWLPPCPGGCMYCCLFPGQAFL